LSFSFKNKIIYLISPERWGAMKISKHHYALELAKRGCSVYFIEPPSNAFKGISIAQCSDHPNIKIVRYKPIMRGRRFMPSFIFNWLIKIQIYLLKKKIVFVPDVVWSFHPYLFNNLNYFRTPYTIFFAADQFSYKQLPQEVFTAKIVIGISNSICDRIRASSISANVIGHGLDHIFIDYAKEQLSIDSLFSSDLVAGYSGNLRMSAIDREKMKQVIIDNKNIKFIFWGSYDADCNNLGEYKIKCNDADTFIQFLIEQPNVVLRGIVPKNELLKEMSQCSFFWICWKLGESLLWDGSNSHKILEYLATGKPVVSHYMSDYKDTELLYMMKDLSNAEYGSLFKYVVSIINKGENGDLRKKRLVAATVASYFDKLKKIEDLINGI
jgi:glycosyltransferase involved in cell wall biosynthesis